MTTYELYQNAEPLSAEEQQELFEHIDDPAVREKLLLANQRLVAYATKKYVGLMDYDDLIQEGNLGLIKAVENFDYTKGYKFVTYAVIVIQREVYKKIATSGMIKTGVNKENIPVISLDEPVLGGDEPLVNLIESPELDQGEKQKMAVDYAMSLLDDQEKEIMQHFFFKEGSWQELTEKYGVTNTTLCNFRDRIIRKLRHPDTIDALRKILDGGDIA